MVARWRRRGNESDKGCTSCLVPTISQLAPQAGVEIYYFGMTAILAARKPWPSMGKWMAVQHTSRACTPLGTRDGGMEKRPRLLGISPRDS